MEFLVIALTLICGPTRAFINGFRPDKSPRLVFETKLPYGAFTHVQFARDGKQLLLNDMENVEIWSIGSSGFTKTFALKHSEIYFSRIAGGQVAVAHGGKGQVDLLDSKTGKVVKEFSGDPSSVNVLTFSKAEDVLLTGGHEGWVTRWDLLRERSSPLPPKQNGGIWSLALSSDDLLVAAGTGNGKILLWNLRTRQPFRSWKASEGSIQGLSFSVDGQLLASCTNEKFLVVWDVSTGKELARFSSSSAIRSVTFSPAGRVLAAACGDATPWFQFPGKVIIWDYAKKQQLKRFSAHRSWVTSVDFSPDGKLLATASHEGQIRVWNLEEGQ